MTLNELGNDEFELITLNFDFYITKNEDIWVLDIFKHQIQNTSLAYVGSFEFDSFSQAKADAEAYVA